MASFRGLTGLSEQAAVPDTSNAARPSKDNALYPRGKPILQGSIRFISLDLIVFPHPHASALRMNHREFSSDKNN
jgi:hypothetical protein